jgi:hypothetical protein
VTLSAGAATSNSAGTAAGFRSMLYPTWKVSEHWSVSGALQIDSRHYFLENLSGSGDGVKGYLLQGRLNYSLVRGDRSLTVSMGQLSSVFGSFLPRYDDMDNPLIGTPAQYGYYSLVSELGLAGAEVDATHGKWDGRAQFANSSPVNPRSVFASDQYGNWSGGGGYSVRQGVRIGASAFRGPYLYRQFAYFFPGEANPSKLAAHGVGVEFEWARSQWSVQGEWQKFNLPYKAIPVFREQTGYIEVKRVLRPHWYVAMRGGYVSPSAGGNRQTVEAAAGFQPGPNQLIKLGYRIDRYAGNSGLVDRTLAIQLVTSVRGLSLARR